MQILQYVRGRAGWGQFRLISLSWAYCGSILHKSVPSTWGIEGLEHVCNALEILGFRWSWGAFGQRPDAKDLKPDVEFKVGSRWGHCCYFVFSICLEGN